MRPVNSRCSLTAPSANTPAPCLAPHGVWANSPPLQQRQRCVNQRAAQDRARGKHIGRQRALWQDATCTAPPAHLRVHAPPHDLGEAIQAPACLRSRPCPCSLWASYPRTHGEHHVKHQVAGCDAQQWLSALASWKVAYSASGSRRWAACPLASSMASFMARLEWGTAATRLSAAPFRGRQAGVAWLRPRKMRELRRRAGRPEHPASAPCFALNTGHRAKAKREADFSEFIGRASLHCMVIARLETDAVGATVNSATAGHRTGAQRKRLSRAARRRASASASATVSHHHFTSTTPPSSIFKRKHMHTSARIGMTPSKAM